MSLDEPKKIQDLPKFAEQVELVDGMTFLLKIANLCSPLLRLMGVDTEALKKTKSEFEDIKLQLVALAQLPDRFNTAFGKMGWVAYEQMKTDVALNAVELAELGDPEAGENILVEHYTAEEIENHLRWMGSIKAMNSERRSLLELARIDHAAGRYHASVPVVLAQIDGTVADIVENNRGFFSEGSDLRAWDCLAGHSSGLSTLSDIMKKGVQKTTSEPMTIPYRNGILHGRSLGYNNRTVSAKAWAALFSIKAWAIKVEAGTAAPPQSKPKPGLKDLVESLKKYEENQKIKKFQADWVPRQGPTTSVRVSSPEQFSAETPEYVLARFFHLLAKSNFGYLVQCVSPYLNEGLKPGEVRSVFGGVSIVSVEFNTVTDTAPAVTEIGVKLEIERSGELQTFEQKFRLLYYGENGEPLPRNAVGRWGVLNWRF